MPRQQTTSVVINDCHVPTPDYLTLSVLAHISSDATTAKFTSLVAEVNGGHCIPCSPYLITLHRLTTLLSVPRSPHLWTEVTSTETDYLLPASEAVLWGIRISASAFNYHPSISYNNHRIMQISTCSFDALLQALKQNTSDG